MRRDPTVTLEITPAHPWWSSIARMINEAHNHRPPVWSYVPVSVSGIEVEYGIWDVTADFVSLEMRYTIKLFPRYENGVQP